VLLRILQRRFDHFHWSLDPAASSATAVAQSHNNTTVISYHTLISLESRLVPYFFINHPTHGALAGPFRKLSNISSSSPESCTCLLGFLALDVAVTLLGLDQGGASKEAETLEKAVGLSLNTALDRNAMPTELKRYWEHALLMVKRK